LLPPKGVFGGEDLIPFVHAYLARSKSFLAMPQIDDISGEIEPVNLPASSSEYPNWHRRLSLTLEELAIDSRLKQSARIFQSERGLLGHASNETSLVRG
jgi:4-alpha-glucanotransferase